MNRPPFRKSKERPENLPVCSAVVLCAAVRHGGTTLDLVAVRAGFHVEVLPTPVDPFFVYYQLSCAEGKFAIDARFYKSGASRAIAKSKKQTVRLADNLDVQIGWTKMPYFLLRSTGEYDMVVFANGYDGGRSHVLVR